MCCRSAFHGKIEEIPGISVDNFEFADKVKARAYFLSHCHSDHTQGLYTRNLLDTLELTNAYIYMSETTAAIIRDETTDERIMNFIKVLKLGTTLVTLPSVPEQYLEELYVNVSLIPAGHSFGSVMFLFKTNTKTVLFTGDFRISPNDVSKYGHFHDEKENPIKIDAMYIDTTFLGYRYVNFPKRSTSMEYAVEEVKKWLGRDERNRVALHTSAKYGYEFVFNEIYEKSGQKVYVNGARWPLYNTLRHLVPGVSNNEDLTKIHVCRNSNEKRDHVNCLPNFAEDHKYLYIHFSAMKWDNYQIDDSMTKRVSETRLDVCFPTHCSRSELLYFVHYFSPKKTVGFPEEFKSESSELKTGCNEIFELAPKKRKLAQINDENKLSVDRKVDISLLRKMFD